jgi:predicted RNase H-like HicB family nuclease
MLLEYIQNAMRLAKYEILEDGTFYGEIPGFEGVWAQASTLEDCRAELQSALEDWLILGLRLGHPIPEVAGLRLFPADV